MSLAPSDPRLPLTSPQSEMVIRLGTRGSALALTQTRSVAGMLAARFPGGSFPIAEIRTEGDRDKASPLSVIGGRGVFTSALETALLEDEIDAAVHSAKDLPSTLPKGLALTAIPAREDPRDVLVTRHGVPLAELPSNPVIGTSSRRRAFQLLRLRPDARIVELRGNLDTRLRKAMESDLDGVILAAAGIARMGWADRVTQFLPIDQFVPAPGQGALAIETRVAADRAAEAIAALNQPSLSRAVGAERAFLRGVGAGCTSPVGAHAELSANGAHIQLTAMLASDDGQRYERATESYQTEVAEERAYELGRRLLTSVSASSPVASVNRPPLAGRRVLVTGAAASSKRLTSALREAGANVVALPMIRVAPASRPDVLRSAVDRLTRGEYEWLVVTSGNAVDALRDVLAMTPDIAIPTNLRIAAVGKETARRLQHAGLPVDLEPEEQTGAGLVEAFHEVDVKGRRILCLLGNLARPTLLTGLREQEAIVDVVEAYRTEPVSALPEQAKHLMRDNRIDAVTFASPSAVAAFVDLLAREGLSTPRAAFACIGPTTRAALEECGLTADIVAPEPSAAALVRAIAAFFAALGGEKA